MQTESLEAQLYFDQGLTFIYAFNHEAAFWSFQRASQIDPKMPMAQWGMALSLGMNINTAISPERSKVAYEASQKAVELAVNGLEVERAYVEALAKRYSDDPKTDQDHLNHRYSEAMEALSTKYPDDPDAAVLYAESILDLSPWNQWSSEGRPLKGTMKAVRTLESILKRNPKHLGANHYYIHAVEASPYPELGLMSAERLKTLLPSSGHLLHMPSHIFMLVGDYRRAGQSNEAAIAADRAYIREFGIDGNYPVHYLTHNYYVLIRAYILQGRYEDAKGAARVLSDFYLPHFQRMPELEYYAFSPSIVLLNFARWDALLEMPKPSKKMEVNSVLWRFCRAYAFAKMGDSERAKNEQSLFLEEKANLLEKAIFGYNRAFQILKIAEHCLRAQLAENEGNLGLAIDELKKGAKEQASLHYNEPPDWFVPVSQSLGGLLLRANKPSDAEAVFREDLKRQPRNGRTLFGLKESLRAQQKQSDLYWVNEEWLKAWMYSDISLSIKSL